MWERSRSAWRWAREHPWPTAIGGVAVVGVPAGEWMTGGLAGRVGEVSDVAAAAAIAVTWRRTQHAPAVAAAAAIASAAGWLIELGHPVEQGGAQVAVALGVGAALGAILRPRRPAAPAEPEGRDVVDEMRRAMVASGICRTPGGGQPPEPPRLVRGGIPDPDAAVIRLSWALPDGVSLQRVRAAEETLSHHLAVRLDGAAVRILTGEDGAVVTEIRRGRLPRSVDFAEFYRHPLPASELVTGVGMSRSGPVVLDFGAVPSVLIGGLPGRGKSAAQRQMLAHLALEHSPEEFRLALVDCKGGVELALFARLPHAWAEVATDAAEAIDLLGDLGAELDRRLAELRRADLAEPNVATWNASGRERWPRILCAVDEVAELVAAGDRKITDRARQGLERIARLGRAAGLHLSLATQRPDAAAVPGQLRATMAAVIAFRCASEVGSRILLDDGRAANLPDLPGRALWKLGGAQLEEIQTPFIGAGTARELLEQRWGRRLVTAVPACPATFDAFADVAGVDDDPAAKVVRLR